MTPDAIAAAAAARVAEEFGNPSSELAVIMFNLVLVSVLRAFGCTCHDPTGVNMCWHTEDLHCPVHPVTVTS